MTPELLKRLGKALVDSVVVEAKKDLVKQGRSPTPRGEPEGLPTSDSFFDSFGFRISGKSTIEITSTWPWVEQHVEGRKPYKMTWATRSQGVYRVPMAQPNGTVIVRFAPLRTADAWIHPGFARHTFLQRGVRKGRKAMAQMVLEEVQQMLAEGNPFA